MTKSKRVIVLTTGGHAIPLEDCVPDGKLFFGKIPMGVKAEGDRVFLPVEGYSVSISRKNIVAILTPPDVKDYDEKRP